MFFYRLQSLADVGAHASVRERDPPIVDVAIEEFNLLAAAREYKVVRYTFVIVEKILLDCIRAVSKAKDKVLVPEMSVVLHNMPKYRAIANLNHWLGHIFSIANSQTQATA